MTKALELQLQHQSFQLIFRINFLYDWLVGSPCRPKNFLSRVFSNTTIQKHQLFSVSLLYGPALTSIHDYWKIIALTRQTFAGKTISLVFNMLSKFVIAFLPRNKCLLISWLQSPSAVILEPRKIACHCSYCFPIYLPWSDGTGCHDLPFLNAEF